MAAMMERLPGTANFDLVARPYRWMEHLTFGRALERCRNSFLPRLADRRCALALGDGDGRFLANLLAANHSLHAEAVDSSGAMLRQLVQRAGEHQGRIVTHRADALRFQPTGVYDLIVTHFFLDCFSQADVEALANRLARHASPGALWLVSDFRIPSGPMNMPAHALIHLLYGAFRVLTGLRTHTLPNHGSALAGARFTLIDEHLSLGGLLTAQLWRRIPTSGAAALHSQHATTAPTTQSAPPAGPGSRP